MYIYKLILVWILWPTSYHYSTVFEYSLDFLPLLFNKCNSYDDYTKISEAFIPIFTFLIWNVETEKYVYS